MAWKFKAQYLALGLIAGPMLGCMGSASRMQDTVTRLESDVATLRSFQAEQTAQISAVQADLRNISGRVDELEYRSKAQLGTGLSDIKREVNKLSQRVPPPPLVPAEELSADEALVAKMAPNVADKFSASLAAIRQGDYSGAVTLLDETAALTYGTENEAVVRFWTGVAYEGMTDNKQAMEAYHQLIEGFPTHPRSRLALLRQASLLIRMGDSATAKIILQKIIADYPSTTEAARAKERLKDLS